MAGNNGGLQMVLLNIFVIVCGSLEFGSCVSIEIFSNGVLVSFGLNVIS